MSRQEYALTEAEHRNLQAASRPVRYLVVGGMEPTSPQERANAIWHDIARTRGVRLESIEPSAKGDPFFTAEPLS